MNTKKNDIIPKETNLRNYIKKGTIKENEINDLYMVTTKKLGDKYRSRLSELLYNGNQVKNYFSKRTNLDQIIYEYNNEQKLYITLANFKKKNKANSLKNIGQGNNNSSFQNYTENISKLLTNDTNNNKSIDNLRKDKRGKFKIKDIYDKFKEERLNIEINRLLLNEEKELPKNVEREIFENLRKKYNFIKDTNLPKSNLNIYGNKPRIRNYDLLYQKGSKNFDSLKIIRDKTNELNKLKTKKYKDYLSPIFFLGKTKDKYLQHISYASYDKLKKENKDKKINDIKKDNIKYLRIMDKDINELHEINSNNKNFVTES